jgi:hypothetical protein
LRKGKEPAKEISHPAWLIDSTYHTM